MTRTYPPDVDPKSRMRLPLPNREDLDAAGQAVYDRANRPGTLAGLQGPAGIQLHSPAIQPHLSALNIYLRNGAGFTGRLREVAILATAREMDSQFEWVSHEDEARKEGVPPETMAAIRDRLPLAAMPEEDALVVELARALWRDHKVSSSLYSRLTGRYGVRMTIDLTVLMGTYANTAGMLALVDLQLPEGREATLPIA